MSQARQTRHSAQSARRGDKKKNKAPVTSPENLRKQLPQPGWRPAVLEKTRVWVVCPGFMKPGLGHCYMDSLPVHCSGSSAHQRPHILTDGGDDYSKISTFLVIPETPKAA